MWRHPCAAHGLLRCDLQRERRKTAAHSRGFCSDKFFLFAGELKAYLAGPAITVILGTRISACRPTNSREDCRRPRPIVQVADQICDSIVVTGTAVLPAIRTRARQLASVRETIFRRVPTLQYLGCVSKSTFVLLYSSERGFSGRGRPVCRSHTYPWDSSGSPGSYPYRFRSACCWLSACRRMRSKL